MALSQDGSHCSNFEINMKNTKILINCEEKSIEKIAQLIFPIYKPSIKM